ncbi:DDHD [Macleaya cordata]|uniref:DDHD n=1 Tax=Macleaya cordata TaxID=56857 RepID=A0A200QCH5_MACCD|nr:DDHD [Macleaya cordata]
MENSAISEATGSYGIGETSPDLLKNTPSNIARLEDVIEQCKGRQKYLAMTRSPSDGEDVRWYFCKVPLAVNEVAASVPRSDIVGKSEYFRFSMRDSLALEASFLQREEEFLSSWWKEYAECSEGPSGRHIGSDTKLDIQQKPCSSEVDHSTQLYATDEERVGVPVKGGLYEVDLAKRQCFPVYWSGENRRVLRGHWFARKSGLDWLPMREDVAEQLEFAYRGQVWHRRRFQPSGLFAARIDLQGSTPGLHALFTGEDDTWEAWLNVDASGISNIISLRGNGIKLRRGYAPSGSPKPTQDEIRQQKEEEMDDYCSQVPVRHLVFMVHGIGQRLEKANLVDDVGSFRHVTSNLAERHLTPYQRDTQRVLFIPCQWRRGLKLGGESAVEKITLDGVRGLRVMLSATVHDVLYYMSPIYCQDIIDSVSSQLNRLYLKFIKRNPGYDGKVSIYGHSLGSILSYDILCHQHNLSSPFPMEWMYKEHVSNEESLHDGTSQSFQCSSSPINLKHTNSKAISKDLEGLEDADEEDKLCSQSSAMVHKEDSKHPSISVHRSPSSDLEEAFSWRYNEKDHIMYQETESKQPSAISLESDDKQPDRDPSDMFSQEEHSDLTSIRCEVSACDSDKIEKNTFEDTSEKDNLIKRLSGELDSLRERIAELKSRCGDEDSRKGHQGDKEVDDDTPKQSLSQKLLPEQVNARKSYRPYIKYTKLEFKVDTFFAVGSPLGVFLALRNIRIGIGKGRDYWQDESICEEMPCCQQMFNIFHPFDPVAYRVEPLVCKEYISKRPVMIPYHRGGKRLHIGFQEFTEDLAARSQAVGNHLHSMRVKILTLCHLRDEDNMEEKNQETEERSYGSIMMERLTGSEEGRIDHMLQDKTFEHPYISAIGSHTNYWRDPDTALFILKHLYRDIPEEPNSPDQSNGGSSDSSEKKQGSTGRFYQSETLDEEDLPLTFSDKMVIKEFSRKVKKVMKNR